MADHGGCGSVAEGIVVDEEALVQALTNGQLGAALDVFAQEPLPPASPLWDLPNVLISPYAASTADSENGKVVELFCENIRCYLDERPLRNVLDKHLLY